MADNMPDIGIWHLVEGYPQRYLTTKLQYEKSLEDWIENDPSLIASEMRIVGRQVYLDTGRLDLLGLTQAGQWAVIEIKRDKVNRKTVSQALDYAGCLADLSISEFKKLVHQYLQRNHNISLQDFLSMNNLDDNIFDQREILIYIVGTSKDIHLDRVSKRTVFDGNPLQTVTFDVYQNERGEQILVRLLDDNEDDSESIENDSPSTSIGQSTPEIVQTTTSTDAIPASRDGKRQRLFQIAQNNGIGEAFRAIYDVATNEGGLYPKLYKWSIMYAPPQNKNRYLICVWVTPTDNRLNFTLNPNAFAEFYPINSRKVGRIVERGFRAYLDTMQIEVLVESLKTLFQEIN